MKKFKKYISVYFIRDIFSIPYMVVIVM